MTIDPSRTVEIQGSPAKMFGLFIAGLAMTAISAAIGFRLLPGIPAGSFGQFAGYVGAFVFALFTGLILHRLLTSRGPVVTIGPEGIRDTRVASEFIPWKAIERISTWELQGQKVMVLAVARAAEEKLTLTRIARWSRGANRKLGADGLCVSAQGLKVKYDALLAMTAVYVEAWHSDETSRQRSAP
jgi:hypothetical protein